MADVPDRATFEKAYAGKAPWDIAKPQGPFAAAADRITSPVLDAGCGTGGFLAVLGTQRPDLTRIGLEWDPTAATRALHRT